MCTIEKIIDTNIPIAITWGGQKFQKYISKSSSYLGIMGTHNPGTANEFINKSDLAEYVEVSIEKMKIDTTRQRVGRPFHFTDLKAQNGVAEVVSSLKLLGGF